MITSVGYHSAEPLKMDPDGGMSLGGGGSSNSHDPFTGGSPPFTGGNEEEFESVQLPPGALSEDQQHHSMSQQHAPPQHAQHPHSIHAHQQQHYPGHYAPHHNTSSPLPYHHPAQQQQQQQQQHPHHQSQWNPYGMNGYVGSYHGIHHAGPPMEPSYYYSNANPAAGPNGVPSSYHAQANPSGGSQGMALPGGPSPAGSHNTPSPQAHSEDGDSSSLGGDPHLRNNNVLKRPGDYSSSTSTSGVHHPLMNPGGGYHAPPLPPAKKAKVPKRKKKRDPNEPQKPVSAYALFFRDSQANIKAANPNAAFGDVSKIVASMWDGLDPDNKAAYKKRTENAKKEYLKKLAAYRASLVSKGSGNSPINESGASTGGGGSAPPTPNNHPPSYGGPAGPYGASYGSSPYGEPGMKPSPNDGYGPPYPPSQQQLPRQQPSYGPPQPGYIHHPSQQMSNGGYGHHHPPHHPGIPPVPSDNHRSSSSPPSGSPLDSRTHLDPTTGHLIETEGGHNGSNNNSNSNNSSNNNSSNNNSNGPNNHQQHSVSNPRRRLSCARPGCNNPISSQDHSSPNTGGPPPWGGNHPDYCSNECVAVVGQCRDVVYSSWASGPPPPPNNNVPSATVSAPTPVPPNGQVQTQ